MRNRPLRRTAAMLAIAAVAACTPTQPSSEGPETDFWGNPIATTCPVNGGTPPPPPDRGGVPVAAIPEGWRQIRIDIEVYAIGTNKYGGISPVCVPFAAHLYGRADEAELVFFEGGRVTTTPWDGPRTTPWGAIVFLQYNPAARPKLVAWQVDVQATYNPERPDAELDPMWAPVKFGCNVIVDGRSVYTGLGEPGQEATVLNSPKGNYVRCLVNGEN